MPVPARQRARGSAARWRIPAAFHIDDITPRQADGARYSPQMTPWHYAIMNGSIARQRHAPPISYRWLFSCFFLLKPTIVSCTIAISSDATLEKAHAR